MADYRAELWRAVALVGAHPRARTKDAVRELRSGAQRHEVDSTSRRRAERAV